MFRITLREFLRDGLHRTSMDHLIMKRRIARQQDIDHLFTTGRKQVFDQIYTRGVWLEHSDRRTRSGSGSELDATKQVRHQLPGLLTSLGARSLLDVGCGDFTWMQHVDLGVEYIGIDIVQSVISANQNTFASPARHFYCIDAVGDPLPPADVVLCREILFHLSLADIKRLVNNVKRSGAQYLIATSDNCTAFNANIRTGDYRPLNLQRRPFHFPRPRVWLQDEAVLAGRGLGAWALDEIL
jgi:SAM-dependent methyltransferase